MNFRILILLFFAVITSIYACKKVTYDDTVAPIDINPPHVNTINATADTINIYQNGIRQNNLSAIYPGGATSYLYFINGVQNFSVKRTNTTNVLVSQTYAIHSNLYYSIFVTGTSSGNIFQTSDAIDAAQAVIDSDATETIGVVRFVNASINSGALNVTVGAGDTVNVHNIAYGTATAFMPFDAAHTEEVKVFVANSTLPAIDSVFTFQPSTIYTLYTRGSLTGTGNNAFAISLAVDPYIQPNQ